MPNPKRLSPFNFRQVISTKSENRFLLSAANKDAIARTLNLEELPSEIATKLEDAISGYRTGMKCAKKITPRSVMKSIEALLSAQEAYLKRPKTAQMYRKVLATFAAPENAMDQETSEALENIAFECLLLINEPNSLKHKELSDSAIAQHKKLDALPDLRPQHEILRGFVAHIRKKIFLKYAHPEWPKNIPNDKQLHFFLLTIFEIVGVGHERYKTHPADLT